MVEFCIFKLVSLSFGFVTGELEVVPWWTFEFLSQLTKSLCIYNIQYTMYNNFTRNNSKVLKPACMMTFLFFIRKVVMKANLEIGGLQ